MQTNWLWWVHVQIWERIFLRVRGTPTRTKSQLWSKDQVPLHLALHMIRLICLIFRKQLSSFHVGNGKHTGLYQAAIKLYLIACSYHSNKNFNPRVKIQRCLSDSVPLNLFALCNTFVMAHAPAQEYRWLSYSCPAWSQLHQSMVVIIIETNIMRGGKLCPLIAMTVYGSIVVLYRWSLSLSLSLSL